VCPRSSFHNWRFGLTWLGCFVVVGVVACKAPPCDEDVLQEGKTYQAVVLEPYSTSGTYPGPDPVKRTSPTCGELDGIGAGTSVSLKLTGWADHGDSCRPASAIMVEVPSGVTILELGSPSSHGPAQPSLRLKALADAFGSRGLVVSLCADDLVPGMRQIAKLVP
jgi:hypothetical protein